MMKIVIQLLAAGAGTLAFSFIYHVRKKYLIAIPILGMISWAVWLMVQAQTPGNLFIPALTSGMVTALLAEILCRILHAPSTVFFLTSSIPLIPGRSLYYCMDAVVETRMDDAIRYGLDTMYVALGIAVGMCVAWAICDFSRKVTK